MVAPARSPPNTRGVDNCLSIDSGACDDVPALVVLNWPGVDMALAVGDGPGGRSFGSALAPDLRAARAAHPEGALLPVPWRGGEAQGEARPPPRTAPDPGRRLRRGDPPGPARGKSALGADRRRRDAPRREEAVSAGEGDDRRLDRPGGAHCTRRAGVAGKRPGADRGRADLLVVPAHPPTGASGCPGCVPDPESGRCLLARTARRAGFELRPRGRS